MPPRCDPAIHRTLLPSSRCILPSRLGTQRVRARRVSPSGETRSTYGCVRGGHAPSRTHDPVADSNHSAGMKRLGRGAPPWVSELEVSDLARVFLIHRDQSV